MPNHRIAACVCETRGLPTASNPSTSEYFDSSVRLAQACAPYFFGLSKSLSVLGLEGPGMQRQGFESAYHEAQDSVRPLSQYRTWHEQSYRPSSMTSLVIRKAFSQLSEVFSSTACSTAQGRTEVGDLHSQYPHTDTSDGNNQLFDNNSLLEHDEDGDRHQEDGDREREEDQRNTHHSSGEEKSTGWE